MSKSNDIDVNDINASSFTREKMELLVDQSIQRERLNRIQRMRNIIVATAESGKTWCTFDSLIENGVYNEITYLVNAGFDVIPYTNDPNNMQCSYAVYFGDNDKIEEFKQLFTNEYGVTILNLNIDK